MLRVGLVGLGMMGSTHLMNYIRLENEGYPIQLVAICDVDPNKRGENISIVKGNLPLDEEKVDFSKYHYYSDIAEMIKSETLDYADLTVPTYLHAVLAKQAMKHGLHVLCEKPMALSTTDCQEMIDTSLKYNRKLMIGQTLRFFPAYHYLKETLDSERYGKCLSASFFRGGNTPKWSFEDWLLHKEKSGGCLLDQHIHDVDTINWLFGTPEALSTRGKVVFKNSGFDIVSTNYFYADNKVVNAQDDWAINGQFNFEMRFRVNFERGALILENGKLFDYPNEKPKFEAPISKESGYYIEIKYFADSIRLNKDPNEGIPLLSTKQTIHIAEKEQLSADSNGKIINC
ncbi:MAG: Gfo/Idh/MocA family oxidoreductase [Sporolactobacillus sp.]|jgi:predicted dehydrogenase|nr:Gfo/Idh/MocA family oxidoreductase [Sporolactobacillus sp.]